VNRKLKACLSVLMMIILVILCGFIYNRNVVTKRSGEVKGRLLIVGGALESGNKEVYEKFIHMAGGRENSFIGIISTASSDPIETAAEFKDELVRTYGVPKENVKFIPIYYDELSENLKTDVNEDGCLKIIKDCTGLWFTGGDQRRIVRSLYNKNKTNSRILSEIYKIYEKGAVIAGTSAGAAVMSSIMIAGGDNKNALMNLEISNFEELPQDDSVTLSVGRGLGLFTYGIIDQHFSERDRLGRLIAACCKIKTVELGFGIDENTAMAVDNSRGFIEVIGEGGVTVVDIRSASVDLTNKKLNISNVRINYLVSGGVYNTKLKVVEISGEKEKLLNIYEINKFHEKQSAASCDTMKEYLVKNLDDNTSIDRLKFILYLSNKDKYEFIFSQDNGTSICNSNLDDNIDFTAGNIRLDIKFIN
jgi:cyanophycinase